VNAEGTSLLRLLVLGLSLALIAVLLNDRVSSDDTVATATTSEATETSSLTGEFLISGSSTVFPIVNKQAEEFGAANPSVAIAVEGPGSGDGARLFCAGDVPVGNASRQYKDAELEECAANGIEFIELRRAIDGISVITSVENDQIECLSFDELYALTSDAAIGIRNWSEANDLLSDIGSPASGLPDAPLDIYAPGEESGTFDSFVEIVIEGVAKGKTGLDTEAVEFEDHARPDYKYSLGWVGFAFAKEAADAGQAKLVEVRKQVDGECVAPTPETIASADFPIARFLYTYINAEVANSDPAVAAFVDYMMSDTGLESVTAAGYIDLNDEDQAKAQMLWADRITGIQW